MAGEVFPLSGDIVVVHSEYEAFSSAVKAYGSAVETFFDQYLTILDEVCGESITEGTVAENLKVFAQCARNISGEAESVTDSIDKASTDFVADINDADEYLY